MRAMTRHRDDDVRRVGDLDAEHRVLGLEVAHHERDDVHRAALHAAVVEVAHDGLHLVRVHPVVGGPAVLLVDRADVGAVLDAGHVGRVGGRVERVRLDVGVQPGEGAGRLEGVGELRPTPRRSRCTSGCRSGWVSSATSLTQSRMPSWVVGACVVAVMPGFPSRASRGGALRRTPGRRACRRVSRGVRCCDRPASLLRRCMWCREATAAPRVRPIGSIKRGVTPTTAI